MYCQTQNVNRLSQKKKRRKYQTQVCAACGEQRAGHVCTAKPKKMRTKRSQRKPSRDESKELFQELLQTKLNINPNVSTAERAMLLQARIDNLTQSLSKLNMIVGKEIAELQAELELCETNQERETIAPPKQTKNVFDLIRAASKGVTASTTPPQPPQPPQNKNNGRAFADKVKKGMLLNKRRRQTTFLKQLVAGEVVLAAPRQNARGKDIRSYNIQQRLTARRRLQVGTCCLSSPSHTSTPSLWCHKEEPPCGVTRRVCVYS